MGGRDEGDISRKCMRVIWRDWMCRIGSDEVHIFDEDKNVGSISRSRSQAMFFMLALMYYVQESTQLDQRYCSQDMQQSHSRSFDSIDSIPQIGYVS